MKAPQSNCQLDFGNQKETITQAKTDLMLWKHVKLSNITPACIHELSVAVRLQMLEEKAEISL